TDGQSAKVRVVHFACHGAVDPGHPEYSCIYLADDKPLAPDVFHTAALGRQTPLLFLNACQVGTGETMLGDYAGFAGGSLRGGFRGFIAPLWSVNDEVARDVAKLFYDAALPKRAGTGQAIGAILREIRQKYDGEADHPHSTYLAYVYYGHPRLKLQRA
ncbi:MAG: hypothetical protein QOH21_620, partial [Acidobacteriota bacterium]|nr:hypothetical protein [Acidobacteriota bacterium]